MSMIRRSSKEYPPRILLPYRICLPPYLYPQTKGQDVSVVAYSKEVQRPIRFLLTSHTPEEVGLQSIGSADGAFLNLLLLFQCPRRFVNPYSALSSLKTWN